MKIGPSRMSLKWILQLAIINISIFTLVLVSSESLVALNTENLENPSMRILDSIERYISDQEEKIEELKRISQNLHTEQHSQDALSWYIITKSLVKFENIITQLPDIQDYKVGYQEEIIAAAMGLFRLQDTYAISTKDMANGNLSSIQEISDKLVMSALDCLELAKTAFDLHPPDYHHALLWFLESQDRSSSEPLKILNEKDTLLPLSTALYHQGNLERAVLALTLLQQKSIDYLPEIEEKLSQYNIEMKKRGISRHDLERNLPPVKLQREKTKGFPDEDIYEKLCRGELRPLELERNRRQLFCYYKGDNAYLKLAQLKAELIHFNPRLIIFRKAISKREAEMIKNMAKPKLTRSVISTTSSLDLAKFRTSRTAWLANSDSPVIAEISERVEDMSGLTCQTAESFQIANYELGGHYMPHFDYAGSDRKHQFANLGTGDRIATVLFYLSNTTAGGATVFPTIRLTVNPQEHDALLWFNLKRNGEGDTKTRHAACPVLLGVKWIANKWLHEYGQEFGWKCGLEEYD